MKGNEGAKHVCPDLDAGASELLIFNWEILGTAEDVKKDNAPHHFLRPSRLRISGR